jgi:hypothetical protein
MFLYAESCKNEKLPGSKESSNNFRVELVMPIGVYYSHELLHLVDVDNIADASEVHAVSIFRVNFYPEDGAIKYLRSVGNLPHIHTVNNPRTEST